MILRRLMPPVVGMTLASMIRTDWFDVVLHVLPPTAKIIDVLEMGRISRGYEVMIALHFPLSTV